VQERPVRCANGCTSDEFTARLHDGAAGGAPAVIAVSSMIGARMPNAGVEILLERFRGGGDVADLAALRLQIDAQADDQEIPAGARFDEVIVGGVPGEWVAVDSPAPGVVIFFHGGAYMFGSAKGYRALTAAVGAAADARVLAVDYRLAPEHAFPAAVDDTLAVYRAVLEEGTPPSQIAFAGDSAGGALAIATMLSAREAGLPLPAAAYGISSWLDLAGEGQSFIELADVDPIMTAEGALGCAAAYLQGSDPRHPLASPIHADLSGLPPILLQVGSVEMFLDDSTRFARNAAIAGVHVEMQVWPEMPHVWHRFPTLLPEAAAALRSGGAFLRQHLATETL
jgi:monoterpene epsilon-lactone hydrolase